MHGSKIKKFTKYYSKVPEDLSEFTVTLLEALIMFLLSLKIYVGSPYKRRLMKTLSRR